MGQKGRVHSVESMGTLDGPGIRFVVFLQGCPLRCVYCHNPDTWSLSGGKIEDADFLVKRIISFKPYMDASGGGVTLSGGEPTLQPDFASCIMKKCKDLGINTALDTAGYCKRDAFEKILPYTDLVLFDIKHLDPKVHMELTGKDNRLILENLRFIDSLGKKIWIRHVFLPGFTDDVTHLKKLGEFLKSLNSLELVELLPYHKLGIHKWEALGLKYLLKDVEPPSREILEMARAMLREMGLNVI
ncbi:pyruvate formate lyase-activating protein [Thermovorax subterraneus]|nr:pyruvate formate lyase-activating protein [Thermovorax subterraneus]